MATVNFQCGHCHNLMAVGQEFLGQQVRCPHCQQVVLAPAPAPISPPEPPPPAPDLHSPDVPRPDDQESIFTSPDVAHEDVFGNSAAPRVELPTEPSFPRLAIDEPTFPGESDAPPHPAPPEDRTVTYAGPEAPPGATATEVLPPEGAAALAGAEAPPDGRRPAPSDEGLPLPVLKKPRLARSNPWVIPLFIAPLIFYSLMATLYILDMQFLHFFSPPPLPHPLEMVPDIEGDNKGDTRRVGDAGGKAKRADPEPDKKADARRGAKRGSVRTAWPDPVQPLPPQLHVLLGGTLAVGDLEVTPLKVERKRIKYDVPPSDPAEASEDSLALFLRLRNRSQDVIFKPMDRYFARARPTALDAIPQYTVLEMGDRKFYGGPLKWVSKEVAKRPDTHTNIEYVYQQVVDEELKPGEEMTTFVCTNPSDKAARALNGYQGPLLWRVQLRRGLVKWTTKAGVEREDSATAVVGVEFNSADVGKPAN